MGLIIGPRLIIHSGGGGGNKDNWLDPVAAEYTKRTSGGSADVGSKAKIGSIKGLTEVWPQDNNLSPTLINNSASAIKTTGFNQWDEVVENGNIDKNTGADTDSTHYRRTKNYTPIFPNTDYYIKSPIDLVLFFYDSNKMFISQITRKNSVITTPENAAYMRFRNNASDSWPTYNNDVCLNLSWAGDRNGEYKKYWENTLNLNLTTITGKLAGAGDSVVIFPDGMKSVGSVFDELTKTTATKRIGSQTITGSTGDTIALDGCNSDTYLCAEDIGTLSGGVLTLSADVSGAVVYYELTTPEEYTLDQALNLSYKVDSYGTEERLPADTASAVNAPIRYDVSYTEPKPSDEK